MHHIAIIGGGCSGTLTAIQIMRQSRQPVFIILVNKNYPACKGIAYGTDESEHLLNVRACNMSAFEDRPNHFVQWLSGKPEYAGLSQEEIGQLFLPRMVYGNYLEALFNHERVKFHLLGKGRITIVSKEATGIRKRENGYMIHLDDKTEFFSNQVVLATGITLPALPVELHSLVHHTRYISNPWVKLPEEMLHDNAADVLLIGSGLTAADAFTSLMKAGWKGTIYSVSGSGITPSLHHQQNTGRLLEASDFLRSDLCEAIHIYKKLKNQAMEEGSNPLLVVDQFRQVTAHLWKKFSLKDKRRFLHFFKSKWNAARHKMPEMIHQKIEEALTRRQLKIFRGRVAHVETGRNFFVIKIKNNEQVQYFTARYVINCTGPGEPLFKPVSDLWNDLLDQSLINPDQLCNGPAVNDDLQTISAAGKINQHLFALGPVVKGTCGESVSVAEIRMQARQVAQRALRNIVVEKKELDIIEI